MMKPIHCLLALLLTPLMVHATNLQQAYEKAYFLENSKGQLQKAHAIYQQLSEADPTPENRDVIRNSLLRMLHIATSKKHEPSIKACHHALLSQTDLPLQELVELTPKGSTLYIPNGPHSGTIALTKNLTLQGEGAETILQATANEPLIRITSNLDIHIESLTLKSQLATSDRTDPPGCALYVTDSKVTLKNCHVEALGSSKRAPLGVYVKGFSNVHLLDSHFSGYAYPIFYADGTEGLVKECIIMNPVDCGFMSHADSEVTLENNIFTGSRKHGVRSTGGTLHLKNNLIIKNRNRGVYLGNKTTHGEIINNLIIENGTGISTFASSDVEMENNVLFANQYSGLDTRAYGQIRVKNNILANNQKAGFTVYEEGAHKFNFGKNTLWNNAVPSIDFDLPSSTLETDPQFKNPAAGDFTVGNRATQSAGHGLTDPAALQQLWKRYEEVCQ